ncbi:MAG: hypothetical protein LIO94_08935 [Clostridiales bacterium]|nr:hypothetical protein [Clostridiales bacterium]
MSTENRKSKYPREVKRGRRAKSSCPAEELCRTYSKLHEEEDELIGDVAYCEERIENPASEMEKQFFTRKRLELLGKKEKLSVSLVAPRQIIETARLLMTENQWAVINQLYIERQEWQNIRDSAGCIMSTWWVSDTRKRAFAVIDEVIAGCGEFADTENG